jgi:hypothetical protein
VRPQTLTLATSLGWRALEHSAVQGLRRVFKAGFLSSVSPTLPPRSWARCGWARDRFRRSGPARCTPSSSSAATTSCCRCTANRSMATWFALAVSLAMDVCPGWRMFTHSHECDGGAGGWHRIQHQEIRYASILSRSASFSCRPPVPAWPGPGPLRTAAVQRWKSCES